MRPTARNTHSVVVYICGPYFPLSSVDCCAVSSPFLKALLHSSTHVEALPHATRVSVGTPPPPIQHPTPNTQHPTHGTHVQNHFRKPLPAAPLSLLSSPRCQLPYPASSPVCARLRYSAGWAPQPARHHGCGSYDMSMDMMSTFGLYNSDVTTGMYNDAALTSLPRTIATMSGGPFVGMPLAVRFRWVSKCVHTQA